MAMTSSPPDPKDGRFWALDAQDWLTRLNSTPQGLRAEEAAGRLQRHGPNDVAPSLPRHVLLRIARKFGEPLVAILLIAAAISGMTGDMPSFFIILTMVALSIGLDVVQEHRAERAVDALRKSISLRASVWRDGRPQDVAVEAIVPGDVIELAPGDLVPADGVVLQSQSACTNEALLTGEPYPVEKRAGASAADAPAGAECALFSGTAFVSGQARMLVIATGRQTRFGSIAAALQSDAPPTAFERGLHALGMLILRLTVFLVLFVLLVHLAFHRPPLESFLFAVALAVGLTPELLPMVTTVTLSRGAVRMAARRVIVKRLAAIHNLGAMDVLCTDKTGTLTQAQIMLAGHPGPDGQEDANVLALAHCNARFAGSGDNPLDAAILAHADDSNAAGSDGACIATLPFDFERRRASVLVQQGDGMRLIVKGAPEELLALCTSYGSGDQAAPLDAPARARLTALHDAHAAQGLRMLGVAQKHMPADCRGITAADESALSFCGFCTFSDPPKPSATAAIGRLGALGVRTKIISGDAAAVVSHLVQTLGLPASGVLSGHEIAAMNDTALADAVEQADLFARIAPDQKMRIIRALQSRGHVVGFMGDGINDAPAIRSADCGLSVDGATDVARAAADMIMLAPDLGVLADGVAEGRRTYANITKYVRMGTSSNFGNMLSMALASIVIPFLPMTAIQILLNNLLYDMSETGIPFDDVDDADVLRPHGWDMRAVLRFTLVMGPISSIFDIATFATLLRFYHASPAVFQTAWFAESICTQILVIFLIRTAGRPWRSRPHAVLAATSLGALAVALFCAFGPPAPLFGFAPLPFPLILIIAGLVAGYLLVAEVAKHYATRPPGAAA